MTKDKKLSITITFKKGEEDLYDFIKAKRNYSAFLKDLIQAKLDNLIITTERTNYIAVKNEVEKEVEETKAYDDF